MSSRITVSLVAEVLKQHKAITPALLREIVEELNATAQSEADEPAAPKAKQQYIIVLSDPTGKLPKVDLVGWVVQIPEAASPASTLDRINAAAHDFNASKKGRLIPVKSVGEACESTSRKFFKNAEVAIKTKLPVYAIVTDNQLSQPPTA